jgi:alkylation response protein AidB-like acyl-CoA dehydrogenase
MNIICRTEDVTRETLVQRAIDLRPMISDAAEETEQNRHVSPAIIDEMRGQDFFRIMQPKRFGGFEYDTTTTLRIILEWSSADASTGWVGGLAIVHQWLIAQYPIQAQEEVWADNPGAIMCGSYAPSGECVAVEGGYRVSGEFNFASGVDVMDWAVLGVFFPPKEDGEKPMPGFALVPKTDYSVDDSWQVMGLLGTGSKTIVCRDVFVPSYRRVTFMELVSGNSPGYQALQSNLYRYAFLSLIAHAIAAPALGCLNGALSSFIDSIQGRETRGAVVLGGSKIKDFQAVQMRVGRAAACLKAAKAMLFDQLAESEEKVVGCGEILDVADRLDNRLTQAKLVELSVEGMEHLFGAVGGNGIFTSQKVQRAWRDAHAIAHHISFNWDALSSMYGQHLLGVELQGQY